MGRVLEVLEGVLEALGGVLEGLDGVLEAMLDQDSIKIINESKKINKTLKKPSKIKDFRASWRVWRGIVPGCTARNGWRMTGSAFEILIARGTLCKGWLRRITP